MENNNLVTLAQALNDAGIPPRFDPHQSRILLEVWQRLLSGRPVPMAAVEEVSREFGLDSAATIGFVKQVSERNEADEIEGIVGLSLRRHPHKLRINGHDFTTWCAWDSLFLPFLLSQPAEIISADPLSKAEIAIKVLADRVEDYAPERAVLSMVVPKLSKDGLPSVEEAWMVFCHQVHFFESMETMHRWFSGKNFNYQVLSIPEGFELGRLAFRDLLAGIQDDR